jgi:serine phosphatase RsbU (regulator of sigma subunit)
MLHEEVPVRLRVLLVEDDPADAYLVSELLDEVDAAVALTVANSLSQVIDDGLLDDVDCVLLDLNLPGTTGGLDGLRRLLAVDPAAAVCVLTGTDDEYLGAAAVAAGAQDYLVKGHVDGTLLHRAIRYAVERRRAQINLRRLREAELQAAESARLERGLMPKPLLVDSRVSVLPFYRAGRRSALLGGDFYDVVQESDGTVHAIIGDVCGHSVDQAALGALLRVSWRALVLGGVAEPAVLPALQQVLVSEREHPSLFTTACTAQITGGQASFRLAGHPPPVLLPRPALVAATVGLPLGLSEDARWQRADVALRDPWAILLYTDGLIEGQGPNPPERLWDTGLLDLLDAERDTPLADLPGRLVERAEVLNNGPLPDDVAILLLASGATDGSTNSTAGGPDR